MNPFFGSFIKLPCLCDFENPGQLPVLQVLEPWGYWWLSLIDFRNVFISYVFEVKESIFLSVSRSYYFLSDLENLGQLPVFTGAQGYWRLGLINVRYFFISYVFKVKETISRRFTKLLCSGDLEIPSPVFTGAWGYWWLGLMNFRNFFTFYVFEV